MKKNTVIADSEEKVKAKVIDWLTFSAGGQLIAFKPEDEMAGIVDIIVKDRAEYKVGAEAFLQIRECKRDTRERVYYDNVPTGVINPREDFFFLFQFYIAVC